MEQQTAFDFLADTILETRNSRDDMGSRVSGGNFDLNTGVV
jgi:hypothetical protein